MSPDIDTSTQFKVLSHVAMHSAKDLTGLFDKSPAWWSMPHSIRKLLPEERVCVVPFEDGQETAVAEAEALELVADAVEMVEDAEMLIRDDEAVETALDELDLAASEDEAEESTSLAPRT